MRKVVAYWHDDEGTLVAGCDDGTVELLVPARAVGTAVGS
jgi:hypothetical protein